MQGMDMNCTAIFKTNPTDRGMCCTFNALAPKYDSEIERDESTSGILDLRREMVASASGRVLEVGAGTGRNVTFYTDAVSDLIVSDYSEPMLRVAAEKVARLQATSQRQPSQARPALARVLLCPCHARLRPLGAGDPRGGGRELAAAAGRAI